MVSVYPIRYKDNNLEFLMIKRNTLSYNWQCVTGSLEKGENVLECAKRELFEETGYTPDLITQISFPQEFYTEIEEQGDVWTEELTEDYNFIARIDQPKDPVLNPAEHTDWKWCSFETAYEMIKWAIEKKALRYIYNYLINNPLIE